MDLGEFYHQLRYDVHSREVVTLGAYMVVGGLLGVFIRALYRRYATTVSNRETFSAVFPAVTLSTILIIFVVKSSLALSLGLVGALSIVRFRAAIKEPEEIVYLFFCIAIGLAMGAEYAHLALGGTVLFTAFVLGSHRMRVRRGKTRQDALLLTITGKPDDGDGDPARSVAASVREVVGSHTVQRLDVDDGELHLRAVVRPENDDGVAGMISDLRSRLPGYRVSYTNLETLL